MALRGGDAFLGCVFAFINGKTEFSLFQTDIYNHNLNGTIMFLKKQRYRQTVFVELFKIALGRSMQGNHSTMGLSKLR